MSACPGPHSSTLTFTSLQAQMDHSVMEERGQETVQFLSSQISQKDPPKPRKAARVGNTPLIIISLVIAAAATATLHHIYLSFLRGREVRQQFWIKNSSNALSTSIQWLCAASVSQSLTQIIWVFIRRRNLTVIQINHLFGLPGPFSIIGLTVSKQAFKIIPIIITALSVQGFTLVSILAPNSLEIGSALPINDTLHVPTILFNESSQGTGWNPEFGAYLNCAVKTSTVWKRILGWSFQSDELITWKPPEGCQNGCNYTIEYPAPALHCSDISQDEILGNANDTYASSDPPQPIAQLPYALLAEQVYAANSYLNYSEASIAMAWRTQGDALSNDAFSNKTVGGARCSLYNTTQRAVVSFLNSTATIQPNIISYNEAFEDFSIGERGCDMISSDNVNTTLPAYYANYYAIADWLFQQLDGSIIFYAEGILAGPNVSTNIATSDIFYLNEFTGEFSPRTPDIRRDLEQLLVNLTVALIASSMNTTEVSASVEQNKLVWEYDAHRLWIIYGIALALTAVSGTIGLACILKDGDTENLSFMDILRVTRNPELDELYGEDMDNTTQAQSVLQYNVPKAYGPNIFGIFRLAQRHVVESN
ncbi:hypothetical protein IW262DRAFT_1528555 [Armillaria fumosa]|nr:hypothetical protein IW262DRAFT_1528555 [Armillaria fumosa]